jgi:hypothetical protein
MKNHDLKIWPEYFTAMMFGNKSFEIRENDRDFKVGDYLTLREYGPKTKEYTGRVLTRQITYIFDGGSFGIPENMVVMSVIMV